MFNSNKINQVSKDQVPTENVRDNIAQNLYTNTIRFTELVANDALSGPKKINRNRKDNDKKTPAKLHHCVRSRWTG